ncbi:MAG: sporulation integral membrane protein YtvI [Firmicutes bacterium]|nr:sporulation integral membrane protein YtvI [Bacillota bacterium]
MNIKLNKYTNFILNTMLVILSIVLAYFVAVTVFKWLLPFIIAYGLARIIEPLVLFLERRAKIPRKAASAISVFLALVLIVSLLIFIANSIVYELKGLVEQLPELSEMLSESADNLLNTGINIYVNLPIELSQFVDSAINALANSLGTLLAPLPEATTKLAKSLPAVLIFTIVLFISTYFISSDREGIKKFLVRQIPAAWIARIVSIKNDLRFALLGYIKAQLILMGITFVEVTLGLMIIGVEYALLLGLLISLIDAVPVLGTGTVLIPWALFSLLTGEYMLALSLIILYAITLLVRQSLEPRIVGGQIGLYPLATLISMYIGLKIFGIFGMILGPVVTLIVRNLQRAGLFRLWRE